MAVRGSGKTGYATFFIYLVVVVLLNVAGMTMFFRADLTSGKVYSLSAASREVVSTLSEPLTVKVFFNSNLPAPYNAIERYLHDLLGEYAVAGNRFFNYQFYHVSGEESEEARKNQELAESYGIHPVQVQNIEQDEVKFQKAYMGVALIHGDVMETLPTITSTDGLEYRITSAIRKMNNKISALLRLEGSVQVKLILSSSLRAVGPYLNITGIPDLPSKIGEIVDSLNKKSFGKLAFSHVDPSMSPDAGAAAARYNILKLAWNEFTDRQGRAIPADTGYAGIVVEHGSSFETLDLIEVIRLPIFGAQYHLTEMTELEKALSETVDDVININEELGYLADHGTHPIGGPPPGFVQEEQQEPLTSLGSLLNEEYSLHEVSLSEGGVPEGFTTMVIAGAKENFTDHELYQIDQFLMKGKNLAIFINAFNEVNLPGQGGIMGQMQQPLWMPAATGLEKLLSHYGVTVRQSFVLDENSYRQKVPAQFGGGERPIYFAPIIKNELINKDVPYLRNIKGLVMLKSSPVEVDDQKLKDSGLTATELFSSSERSWEMKERVNLNPMAISPPADETAFRSVPLAYMIEGSFPSYFAEKPVPEKERADGQGSDDTAVEQHRKEDIIDMSRVRGEGITLKTGKPAKLFVIGTSEILKDNVIDEEGNTPNAQFVMNVIDYLNGREQTAVMRSKTQRFNPLRETSPSVRTATKGVNIAGLPALIIIAGAVFWGRRASRKRMIQKMFSQ
ncbi:MAG: Gldg family protein [Nitrospiraceae bacterium]|nr:MAG: Gldg family protein [Nitrospiraceae bacterium]